MNNPNPQETKLFTVFAIAVAVFSWFLSVYNALIVPKFQSLYAELEIQLFFFTQIAIHSYRWFWLVSVLSAIIWFLNYQQMLSQRRALYILKIIAICSIIYEAVCMFGLYQPLFGMGVYNSL
jgi:type II secretory pathway component PulF